MECLPGVPIRTKLLLFPTLFHKTSLHLDPKKTSKWTPKVTLLSAEKAQSSGNWPCRPCGLVSTAWTTRSVLRRNDCVNLNMPEFYKGPQMAPEQLEIKSHINNHPSWSLHQYSKHKALQIAVFEGLIDTLSNHKKCTPFSHPI